MDKAKDIKIGDWIRITDNRNFYFNSKYVGKLGRIIGEDDYRYLWLCEDNDGHGEWNGIRYNQVIDKDGGGDGAWEFAPYADTELWKVLNS